ncbi:MAG: hypothetical protein JO235_26145 [Chroococcidiopsidaceae cyanobacterium CP_BM_RX_35]|nr:hypothetical protein [Chroococcidiopsidaceae cyanobacterium CP_BM_RX_35]
MQTKTLETNSIPIPVQLAAHIGIAESVVLQQIHYWLSKECRRIVDGVRWIYNSYTEWKKQMPFLSVGTIRKAIARLEGNKLIKTAQFDRKCWNQTKFYTIDYERLKALQLSICPNETDRNVYFKQIEVSPTSSSYTKTTPEKTSETTTAAVPQEMSREEIRAVIAKGFLQIHPVGVEAVLEAPSEEPSEVLERDNYSAAQFSEVLNEIREVVPLNPQLLRVVKKASLEVVKDALAALVEALSRNQVQNPCGWLIRAIEQHWKPKAPPTPQIETKEYPAPSSKQLSLLKSLGKVLQTTLNEPGYPQVFAVDIGSRVVPWWQALKIAINGG